MWIRRKYSWYFRQKEFVRSVHHPRFFCFSIFFSFFYFLCVYFCLRSFRSTQTERRVNVGGETRKQLLWLHCFFFLLYVCVFIVSVFLLPFFVLFCFVQKMIEIWWHLVSHHYRPLVHTSCYVTLVETGRYKNVSKKFITGFFFFFCFSPFQIQFVHARLCQSRAGAGQENADCKCLLFIG